MTIIFTYFNKHWTSTVASVNESSTTVVSTFKSVKDIIVTTNIIVAMNIITVAVNVYGHYCMLLLVKMLCLYLNTFYSSIIV